MAVKREEGREANLLGLLVFNFHPEPKTFHCGLERGGEGKVLGEQIKKPFGEIFKSGKNYFYFKAPINFLFTSLELLLLWKLKTR